MSESDRFWCLSLHLDPSDPVLVSLSASGPFRPGSGASSLVPEVQDDVQVLVELETEHVEFWCWCVLRPEETTQQLSAV